MALLVVLFIVFAVVVISMGLLYRSDMALACGQNLCLRNQSDYLAWAGLEHARAYIQSYGSTALKDPNEISISQPPFTLDSSWYYDLNITASSSDESDPNNRIYTYGVISEGWYGSESDQQAQSILRSQIRYYADDPNSKAVFLSISRQ